MIICSVFLRKRALANVLRRHLVSHDASLLPSIGNMRWYGRHVTSVGVEEDFHSQ